MKKKFSVALPWLLLVIILFSGYSYKTYFDQMAITPRTADFVDYNGSKAIMIAYDGTGTYGTVVSTRTGTSGEDNWTFAEDGTTDASVGTSFAGTYGVIYASNTANDTIGEFVAEIDADANWTCRLIGARDGEDTDLLESRLAAGAAGALTCYSTNTYTFVENDGSLTEYDYAFAMKFDTAAPNGCADDAWAYLNDLHWGQTPDSGKRIVLTYIAWNVNETTTSTIKVYFDNTLRLQLAVTDDTAQTFLTDTEEGELWAPVDARVQVKADGDVVYGQAAGNYLLVSWYQL